ncbi:MAG: hypothetical protein KJ600_02780 [Nanoarchaeota archaeon]|nr:hypothetical protein [Nanoarchaeota archaeon]MBU1103455.1 hypothetical protein [Nanoarchaeota archaeon]
MERRDFLTIFEVDKFGTSKRMYQGPGTIREWKKNLKEEPKHPHYDLKQLTFEDTPNGPTIRITDICLHDSLDYKLQGFRQSFYPADEETCKSLVHALLELEQKRR